MISIVMPTYNRAYIIDSSIKSVLAQTYSDFELIIVDDGSTDDTEKVIKSFNDKRIRYIKLEKNSGASHARNIGIENAKGEYITFHDSDDTMASTKLEEQYNYMKENDYDISFCEFEFNKKDMHYQIPSKKQIKMVEKIGLFNYILKYGNIVSTLCIFAKKSCFDNNRFNEELPRLQDYDLALRLSKQYDIKLLKKVLAYGYVQTDSISSNPIKLKTAVELMENDEGYGLNNNERKIFKYKLNSIYANNIWKKNPKEAIIYFKKSLKNKFNFKNFIKYTICKFK